MTAYIHSDKAANVAIMIATMAVSEADRQRYGDLHVKCGACGAIVEARGAHEGPVCDPCWDLCGIENAHQDGHHDAEPAADCPWCAAPEAPASLAYPGTPTDPTVYAQVHGPAVIAFLSETADGTIFRSEARVIEPGAVRRVMSVMGCKLFYGLRADGAIVEYVLTGTRFVSAEREARAECALLWQPGAFCGKTWEVYGVVREVTARHDLSPVETTVHAARWARALGY